MSQKKQMVIKKEDAVFWMDENGFWNNEHGRFEHRKVIRYFNISIKKDASGYFVHQVTDDFEEKVYFPYAETAIFAVDLKKGPEIKLVLNTARTASFDDGELFSKNDNLYLQTDEHLVKFTSQALVKLSRYLKDDNGDGMQVEINGSIYPVTSR